MKSIQSGIVLVAGEPPKMKEIAIFLNNFPAAMTTSLVYCSLVILMNVLYLSFDSIISFLDCQLFLIVLRLEAFVFLFAHNLTTCFRLAFQSHQDTNSPYIPWLWYTVTGDQRQSRYLESHRLRCTLAQTWASLLPSHWTTTILSFSSLCLFSRSNVNHLLASACSYQSLFLSSRNVWFDSLSGLSVEERNTRG